MDNEISIPMKEVSIVISSPSEVAEATCRVCQCRESDEMGDAALGFLGIISPLTDGHNSKQYIKLQGQNVSEDVEKYSFSTNGKKKSVDEFVCPKAKVLTCNADVEFNQNEDKLLELGCACKNDLALIHYACALKWFINHGSMVCEVCGHVAKNVKVSDIKKVESALREYEALREKTANGGLIEIARWFNPTNKNMFTSIVYDDDEEPFTEEEELVSDENTAAKWVVEGTGILLGTGFLIVILAWLIAPQVGESSEITGLHFLLGGSALTIVIFFRFFVLKRLAGHESARYWAILLLFWFLEICYVGSIKHEAHAI